MTAFDGTAKESAPHPLGALAASRASSFGPALAAAAFEAGLTVTQPDGSQRAIPVGAIPVILDDAEVARRALLASHLVAATAKAARWLMAGAGRDTVLSALGPAERELVLATWDGPQSLAVARVDFMVGVSPQALEVNTTIPAMQGYSDIAAASWLATYAAGRSDLAALVAANGSNTLALLDSLRQRHERSGRGELGRLGLLCRRGDSQLGELRHLRDRFRDAGLDARIVHPDQLTRARGMLCHDGEPLPLIYRHLFASRLDPTRDAAIMAALAGGENSGTLVLNRATPHLEMKSTLALLSQAADDERLASSIGLETIEVQAVRASVPWTRRLDHSPEARGLLAQVQAEPEAYVLKRSWSYGGNEVFVGRGHRGEGFWPRVNTSFPEVRDWAGLCQRAAADARGGGFVVQRAVARVESAQVLCTPDVLQAATVTTDYAAYASLGADVAWSGVCRAAASDVVNIVGGGAVVPLIRREVADRLLAAARD